MDEGEMSQILKEAFRLYGSEVGQACNVPTALKPLVNGEDAQVTVSLSKGNTLTLSEIIEDETCKKKLRICRQTVKIQASEIKSLQEQFLLPDTQTQETDVKSSKVIYTVDDTGTQQKEE